MIEKWSNLDLLLKETLNISSKIHHNIFPDNQIEYFVTLNLFYWGKKISFEFRGLGQTIT